MTAPEVSNASIAWFPVVTLILGFAISSFSDWVKNRREGDREREARRAARRDQLSDLRRQFQRETLLALQEAIQDLARATGASHSADEAAYKATGQWQRQLLGDELNQQLFLANRRVLLLTVRVRDESLRNIVVNFRQLTNEIQLTVPSGSEVERRNRSNAALQKSMPFLEQIHERIGEILRTLDDEEAAL